MAGKLSYSIAVNMVTDGVKKGAAAFKNELQSMQYKALAFVSALGFGGIGLSNFTSKLIETARETNRASIALKNVSGSVSGYVKNQKFLLELSKQYGIEINSLTGSYAKFKAAADSANMPMQDQEKIFASMSRASTAFGLSAEDTNLAFLAITQMMSKGKISSEELRRQMGEKIPIAMAAMAKAAGVPINKLDKLLQQGKLMSADVLPGFADALNEMLPNVDTDNLETSLNRLKNTFTDFTKGTGFLSTYKKLIDSMIGITQWFSQNIAGVFQFIVSLVSGLLLGKLWGNVSKFFTNSRGELARYQAQVELTEQRLLAAREARIQAEKLLEAAQTDYDNAQSGQRLAARRNLYKQQAFLQKATTAEQVALAAQQQAVERASQASSLTGWRFYWATLKGAAVAASATIKAAMMSMLPMAVMVIISEIIGGVYRMAKAAKEAANIFKDYQKASNAPVNTAEIQKLKTLQQLYKDGAGNAVLEKKYRSEIVGLLGGELKATEDINAAIERKIQLLEAQARVEFETQKKLEAESDLNDIYAKYGSKQKFEKKAQKGIITNTALKFIAPGIQTQAGIDALKAIELKKVIDASDAKIKEATAYVVKNAPAGGGGGLDDPGDDKKTVLQKAEEDYAEEVKKLTNQRENERISSIEYNKAMDELNKKTADTIGGLLSKDDASKNKTFQAAASGVRNPLFNESEKVLEEFNEEQAKYNKQLSLIGKQKEVGMISDDEFISAVNDLVDSTAKSVLSINGIGDAADYFVRQIMEQKFQKPFISPTLSSTDSSNWEKSDSEKMSDIIATNKDNIEAISKAFDEAGIDVKQKLKEAGNDFESLRSQFNGEAQKMLDTLYNLMSNTPDLETALKLQNVTTRIKELKQELDSGGYEFMNGVVDSVSRVYSAFKNLKEVYDPASEATGWEKFFATFETFTTIVDGIVSAVEAIKTLTQVTKAMASAKQAEAAISKSVAAGQVADNVAVAGSGAAASVASVPIVGPLLALAALASVVSAIASISKFATGGIVGGSSKYGDKILARVNSEELILNTDQQSTVWGLMNQQRGGSLSADVRLQGEDIYLSLRNHMKKTGNKL